MLATQRPRGAVSDALRANTNLRLAMRVADEGESRDVIEAPDAASIPAGLPGRAIALTGRGPGGAPALVELQVAYAGGRSTGIADRGGVRVACARAQRPGPGARARALLAGRHAAQRPAAPDRVRPGGGRARAAARAASAVAARAPRAARPRRSRPRDAGAAVLGLVDDPAEQAQRPFDLDLERDGGMLVYGASGSGRTALLRTLACSLAALRRAGRAAGLRARLRQPRARRPGGAAARGGR